MFVSAGYNCTPRIHMKHHFGLTKQGGQPSCCFDLCVTPFSALVSAIEDDFAHFFDLLIVDGTNAEGDRSKAGRRNIANAYGMTFNHEGSTHSHLFAEGKNDDDFISETTLQNFANGMRRASKTLETRCNAQW